MSVGGAGVLSVVGESSLGIGCAWFAVIGGTSMTSMKGAGMSGVRCAVMTSIVAGVSRVVGSDKSPQIGSVGIT